MFIKLQHCLFLLPMLNTRNYLIVGLCVSFIAITSWSQVDIFTEDFQSGIPSTWGLRNYDGNTPEASVSEYTQPWISKVDPDSSANLTASSTSYFSPIGIANRWLISPPITLGSYGNIFSWRARSHDASFPDNYLILVSKTDTAMSSFTDTVGLIIGEYVNWTNRSANLSNLGLDNETIYLAFILQTNDGFKLYVDDLKVQKEDPVGLEEKNADLIKIQTLENSVFKILGDFNLLDVTVLNSNGQLVKADKTNTIDLSNEKPGIYFLQVQTSKGLFYRKVVKL